MFSSFLKYVVPFRALFATFWRHFGAWNASVVTGGQKVGFLDQKVVKIGSNFGAFGTKGHQKAAKFVQKEDP